MPYLWGELARFELSFGLWNNCRGTILGALLAKTAHGRRLRDRLTLRTSWHIYRRDMSSALAFYFLVFIM